MLQYKRMHKYRILTLSEKEELMKYCNQYGSKEASKKYKVPIATIAYWQARVKSAKSSDAHPLARRYLVRPEIVAYIKELRKKHPANTLRQIQEEVAKKYQVVSLTRIWHAITGR